MNGDLELSGAPDEPASILRVLLIARQPVTRAGLQGILAERQDTVLVVGAASSPGDIPQLAAKLQPTVALVVADSADELAMLASALEGARLPTVVLSNSLARIQTGLALEAGVRGFLRLDVTAHEIVAALNAAAQGLVVLDTLLVRLPPELPGSERQGERPRGSLSDRELEVLGLVALGLPNKAIARRLRISEHTVKFHVGSILSKLDAVSRTDAVTRAARRGLLAL